MFEEISMLDSPKDEMNTKSRSGHRSDYEAERSAKSDYKDPKSDGSKEKAASSSDYKANAADYDLSHNLSEDLYYNLDFDSNFDLNLYPNFGQSNHLVNRPVYKQVGKDAIKAEELRTIVRSSEQQNQITANETATKLADYAQQENISYREIYEQLYEVNEQRVEGDRQLKAHLKSYERLLDNGVDLNGSGDENSDERDKPNKLNANFNEYKKRSSERTRTARRYLSDDLEENLSLRTPSPDSENLDSILFDTTDELPDLLLSSPTLSYASSFPSIDSLNTLLSSANGFVMTRKSSCPNCSPFRAANRSTQAIDRVGNYIEGRKESERRGKERRSKSIGKTTNRKETKKPVEQTVEMVEKDGKKIKKFSSEAFWGDVLRDESSSEDRAIDLDQLKLRLKRQLSKFKLG